MADSNLQRSVENCTRCHQTCTETLQHCLQMSGKHAEKTHVGLLLDWIDICQVNASFMLRESNLHHLTCSACAEVFNQCADDCERMGDDQKMQKCAEVCHECARSCGEMAA